MGCIGRIRKLLDKRKRNFSLEQVSDAAPSYFDLAFSQHRGDQYSQAVFAELDKASKTVQCFIELVASIARSFDSDSDKPLSLSV